ncbi:MAG: ACP S-malonyltransferase [bacterium]|nr:ACP S-malonyltransferase [bacterium]
MHTKTIAMMFPGQGSQAVGMGRALAESNAAARAIFEQADTVLGRPLSRLCFEGPEDELKQTVNTQPALYVTSAAALAVLREAGIEPAIVAGHSLGEYTALYAADVFDFETGLRLVQARGTAMFEAGQARPGTMAALLSLEGGQVEDICHKASAKGCVVPANWNSPGQIVVSGDTEAVAEAVRLAQEAGSKRSVMLSVSGAFHSPLVQSAVDVMKRELAGAAMQPPRCMFVANVSAALAGDVETIRQGLADQIVRCVRWAESVETMAAAGADVFIEVGAGKVLSGLLRRINKDLAGANFAAPEDLEKVRAALG